jgi:hypothetical protein
LYLKEEEKLIGIVVVEISVVTNLKKNLEDNSDNNLRYKNKVQDSFYEEKLSTIYKHITL